MPARMLRSVDFPHPDGPTMLTKVGPDASKDTPSSATTERSRPSKIFPSGSTLTTATGSALLAVHWTVSAGPAAASDGRHRNTHRDRRAGPVAVEKVETLGKI